MKFLPYYRIKDFSYKKVIKQICNINYNSAYLYWVLITCQARNCVPGAAYAKAHMCQHIDTHVRVCTTLLLPLWNGALSTVQGEHWKIRRFEKDEVPLLLHRGLFAWIIFIMDMCLLHFQEKNQRYFHLREKGIWYFVIS